ncbi:N-acetylmuramoyl-L-alanine amidase [Reinekea sp.]|jgi:N-acetylmuramoyl-L-alanine amidase|uniref:N-acetylmuramoyl-L-alanine amidase n=1 Tax=Reinekea sp. TaxID=1970455 RepID=UPI003988AB87
MKKRTQTKRIVVHCSATKAHQTHVDAALIRDWHVNDNGWSDIGYNAVILRDGTIEMGRQEGAAGAHARGYNHDSFAICLVGGMAIDGSAENNFTKDQFESAELYIRGLLHWYQGAEVIGHRDLPGVTKQCPCFDVQPWWSELNEMA